MNKNFKGILAILIVLTILAIVYFLYRKFSKNSDGKIGGKFKEGYSKNVGDFVGWSVTDYDKEYYQMENTSGGIIYVEKEKVTTKPCPSGNHGTCAYAKTELTVKYIA